MYFRVTFSNNVNEYYKKEPDDISIALTVEANSFNGAQDAAKRVISQFVKDWHTEFEIVMVHKLEREFDYEVEYPEFDELERSSSFWSGVTGILVLDPDGWDRMDYDNSWSEKITRGEFLRRASMSTCKRWPDPLWDEA